MRSVPPDVHPATGRRLVGRLRYVLAHGVKEGLVERSAEWPGLTSLPQLLGPARRLFRWFNWTKRWSKRGGGGCRGSKPGQARVGGSSHWRGYPGKALGGAIFFVVLALQQEVGYSPLEAGASLLPITALMLLLSPSVGGLAQRVGSRLPMLVGPLVCAVGLALFTRIEHGGTYVGSVLPGAVGLGLGLALTVGPLTATVLDSVAGSQAGIASGFNNAVARIAGLLAVALLPGVSGLAGHSGTDFLVGVHRALWISASLCVVGGVCSWLFIPGGKRGDATKPG
ncbi:hypothetical protein JQX13_07340 [Archangium violaceum]|uniref:MFS transporter n=1 Tax=Archangium violaceum TaxID=83451 RepID=UPI00193B9317|nr:MFS transporter [Archangium violaceum]QRK14255.1 hypothetical protein JQX13_07340 [Archangium violaceum]